MWLKCEKTISRLARLTRWLKAQKKQQSYFSVVFPDYNWLLAVKDFMQLGILTAMLNKSFASFLFFLFIFPKLNWPPVYSGKVSRRLGWRRTSLLSSLQESELL